jgi:hypothetical protein
MAGRVSLSPGPLDDQAAVPSGRGARAAGGFFFGRMPKKNRTILKRLMSSSYKVTIRAKETTEMIRNFGTIPMFQGMTNQPTQRMTVWWSK